LIEKHSAPVSEIKMLLPVVAFKNFKVNISFAVVVLRHLPTGKK